MPAWVIVALFVVILGTVLYVDIRALRLYRKFVEFLLPIAEERCQEMVMDDWTVLARGNTGNIELENRYLTAAQHMYDIFCRKNHDYGSWNLAIGGPRGLVLRISDKVSRLWQITGLNGDSTVLVQDESMADTFMDIANYAMVGYLMSRGEWPSSEFGEYLGAQAIAGKLTSFIDGAHPLVKELVKEYLDINE